MPGTFSLSLLLLFTLVWIRETGSTTRMKRSLHVVEDQLAEPFIADHPFLWLLRDNNTGTWIFLGRLVEPCFIRFGPEMTPDRHNDEL